MFATFARLRLLYYFDFCILAAFCGVAEVYIEDGKKLFVSAIFHMKKIS